MLASLQDDLRSVSRQLASLGPRPKGEPQLIRDYGNAVLDEATSAADAAGLVRSVPSSVVFIGPASFQMKNYAGRAAGDLLTRASVLRTLAYEIGRTADRLEARQEEYDTQRAALGETVDGLLSLIGALR